MIRFAHVQIMGIINLFENTGQVPDAVIPVQQIIVMNLMEGIGIAQEE